MNVDTVVFAIGLTPNGKLLEEQGIETDRGLIKIDEEGQTNIKGVFAGGDSTESKSSVCKAVAAGKKAAIGIAGYLQQFEGGEMVPNFKLDHIHDYSELIKTDKIQILCETRNFI